MTALCGVQWGYLWPLLSPESPHSDTFTPLRHLQSRPRSWGGIWAKLGVSGPSDVLRLSDFPQPPPPSRRVWQRRVPSVLLWLKTFQGSGRRDIRAGCSALFAMGAPPKCHINPQMLLEPLLLQPPPSQACQSCPFIHSRAGVPSAR